MRSGKRLSILMMALGLLLAGCGKAEKKDTAVPDLLEPIAVAENTITVERQDFYSAVYINVSVVPQSEELSFAMDGTILDFYVTTGQMVKKGDALAQIDQTALTDSIKDLQTTISYEETVYEMRLNQADLDIQIEETKLAKLKAQYEEQEQKKAEEEARKKAEEEARKKAEEEALKKAEEEALKKAEEEAQKKAEEEAQKREESAALNQESSVIEESSAVVDGSEESSVVIENSQLPEGGQESSNISGEAGGEEENSQAPEGTQQPENSQAPENSQQPEDSQTPEDSQQTENSQAPEGTQQPEDSQTPEENVKPQETVTKYDLQKAALAIQEAELAYSQLQDQYAQDMAQRQGELQSMLDKVGEDTIYASFDGRVVKINYSVGDYVQEYDTVMLLVNEEVTLLRGDKYSNTSLSRAENLDVVIDGVTYDVTYIPYDDEEYLKKSMNKEPLPSWFEVEESEDISFGESGTVRLYKDYSVDTLVIPSSCIYTDDLGSYVYKAENGQRIKTYVTIGIQTSSFTEIVDGLNEGEEVYGAE